MLYCLLAYLFKYNFQNFAIFLLSFFPLGTIADFWANKLFKNKLIQMHKKSSIIHIHRTNSFAFPTTCMVYGSYLILHIKILRNNNDMLVVRERGRMYSIFQRYQYCIAKILYDS